MHGIIAESEGADERIEAYYRIRCRIAPIFDCRKVALIEIARMAPVGTESQKKIFARVLFPLLINVVAGFEHEKGVALPAFLLVPNAIVYSGQCLQEKERCNKVAGEGGKSLCHIFVGDESQNQYIYDDDDPFHGAKIASRCLSLQTRFFFLGKGTAFIPGTAKGVLRALAHALREGLSFPFFSLRALRFFSLSGSVSFPSAFGQGENF